MTAPTGNLLTVQASSDTCAVAAGYLEKIHDFQLEEWQTAGRHVMRSNA
jgi:hypothetical protein